MATRYLMSQVLHLVIETALLRAVSNGVLSKKDAMEVVGIYKEMIGKGVVIDEKNAGMKVLESEWILPSQALQ